MPNHINTKTIIFIVSVILVWFLPYLSLAADLPPVGDFAAVLIRWVLSVVGVKLVLLIVYGGLILATSAGDENVPVGVGQ